MKKAISISIYLLFVLTILFPAGVAVTAGTGYNFELISIPAFTMVLTALSVCITICVLICNGAPENKALRILSAIITPFSLINTLFCIFECPQIPVIASGFLHIICCCCLTVKYGKPLLLRIIALVLSALMIFPLCWLSLIALIFGNVSMNTVVQTAISPSGECYAEVIDSDHGALGGDTFVDVYKKSGVNLILFKIEKKPQRVYSGNWGEFKNMQIHWKSDNCLVINSVEYEIE